MDTGRFRAAIAVLAVCGIVVLAATLNPSLIGLAQAVIPISLLAGGYLFGSGFAEKIKEKRDDRTP